MKSASISVLVLLLLSIGLHAQIDSINVLKPFTLLEYRISPTKAFRIETIDTNAKKFEILDGLDELLKRNSNVFVKDYGPGALSTISVRNLGAHHTALFWNGIRLNSGMNGKFDFSLLPNDVSETAVIQYGGGSMINGAGGLGGAVKKNNDWF